MTEEEKFQELGIAMDQAIGVIVEKAAELAEIATDLIVDAAQTVGKNSKKAALEAGDIKSAARETESKLYDGPLTAKDIPEQIKKELHEFFET